MKKRIIILVLIISIVLVLPLSACKAYKATKLTDDLDLLQKVLEYIDEHYIEGLDVDKADLLASLAVVGGLDRFSYITDGTTTIENNAGIGIIVTVTPYREHIVSLILEGSPASEEKEDGFFLMRGDYIYAVNDNRVEGLSSAVFQELAAGGEGTTLELLIKREGVLLDKTYSYTKVATSFPQAIYIDSLGDNINEKLGYIRLRSFTGTAVEDFETCIASFQDDEKEGLILDLRGNSGGQSSILEHIASYFVPIKDNERKTILELDYKENGQDKRLIVNVHKNNYLDIPLIMLTDSSTASASEALIGAIRAFGQEEKVVVIGQPTYGKGVFQNYPVELIDKRGDKTYALYISLVTGYYYIVDPQKEGGRYCIHENPLLPDIEAVTEHMYELFKDNEIVLANQWFELLNN